MMVLLEILILISAVSVTLAPALIRSTLFLMLTFLLSGLYLAFVGAELLSLLFLLVYIGAISVLFLFVVMLLQLAKNEIIQFSFIKQQSNNLEKNNVDLVFSVISGALFILFLFGLYLTVLYSHPITYEVHPTIINHDYASIFHDYSDVYNLGAILFTWYWFAFIIITFIIILASFGVIIILK
jgi:NADH-quinone oxidoreductase subunit J